MDRRRFLQKMLLGFLAACLKPLQAAWAAEESKPLFDSMPLPMLGKTKEIVSALGLSGAQLAKAGEETAVQIVREAINIEGKTVIDLVWQEDGAAQAVAKALKGANRDKYLLVTGTDGIGREACLNQLKHSLSLLGVATIDAWMIKESIFEAGPEHVFSKEGAVGAALLAREKQMLRYIGMAGSGTTDFFMAGMKRFYNFRVAEIPVNGNGARLVQFIEKTLPYMRARNIGTIVSNPFPQGLKDSYPLEPEKTLALLWSEVIRVVAVAVDSPEALHTYVQMARHYETLPRALRPLWLKSLATMQSAEREPPSVGLQSDHSSRRVEGLSYPPERGEKPE